jgi:hypothetical protein
MADISQNVIDTAKDLLQEVSVFLKNGLPDVMQRALTIKKKTTDKDLGKLGQVDEANKSNISIIIGQYKFTLIEKIVIFDRRYVNFNVYSISVDNQIKIDKENEAIKKIFIKEPKELAQAIIIILDKIDTIEKKISSIRTLFKMSKIDTVEKQDNYIRQFSNLIKYDRKYALLIHQLTAYASSSQVGAWRLCKIEPVNRLNKFDDYVQSTVIHWKLARFICYWFYRPELLWADETVPQNPQNPEEQQIIVNTQTRNNIRNNRAPFVYPNVPPVRPPNGFPQNQNTQAAIPVYYVMEDRLYAYQSFPQSYNVRTAADNTITCKIVDRGLGSPQCYSRDHPGICPGNRNCPLLAPCPFRYWNDNGTCGDNLGENTIKLVLNRFSQILNGFYNIEQENGSMKITELYTDCMVYKNFKQEAHVFKVRLIPIPGNNFCYPNSDPPDNAPIPADQSFYKQEIDVVFVHYTIQQWGDPNYEPKECYDFNVNQNADPEPSFNVQGYYILTIIPTKVLNVNPAGITLCDFNNITDIGLFMNYIKAGYYVCKPLDYRAQCRERTFDAANLLTVINLEYFFTGTRYNPLWPFKTLFGYTDPDILALSKYSEDLIYSPTIQTKGLKRLLTLPPETQNPQLRVIKNDLILDDIDCKVARIEECPCDIQENEKNSTKKTTTTTPKITIKVGSLLGPGQVPGQAQVQVQVQGQGQGQASVRPKRSRYEDGAEDGAEGGRKKTNKNRKQYKNKLQTYKRKKCKQTKRHRKTMKRLKKMKIKKRSL